MKRKVADGHRPSPDVRDLRAFCHVVDLGSITAAAKAVGETKGTISRRLTRLERVLGAVLVHRSPRRVQATDDGATYRARVGRALELLDDANAQAQNASAAPSGHLRVTAPNDLGLSLVAPMIAAFVERYPEITVEMVFTQGRLDFDTHQIDVAIRASAALADSALVARKLQDIDGRLYAAPSYLAGRAAPRRPEDLASHQMIIAPTAVQGRATLTLRRGSEKTGETVKLRAAVSSSDFFACKEAAVAGGGIVLLPSIVARRDLEAGRLVPVLRDYVGLTAAIYLVVRGTRFLQPKVRVFRDFIVEAFAPRGRR